MADNATKISEKTDSQLQAMLQKNSGASVRQVRSALAELKKRGLPTPPEKNVTGGRKFNRGGDAKKKVPAIAISFGMVDAPKNGQGKAKMMRGGMANKRMHMYTGGGAVKDNLKPLPKGPKGKGVRNLPDSVQMNMGFDPKS